MDNQATRKVMLFHQLSLICNGYLITGVQMDVICGSKLEVVTFSGTELLMYMRWGFAKSFLINWEIHLLHQDVQVLKAQSLLH